MKKRKPFNAVAKDLRTPKYRMRVVANKRKKNEKHKVDYVQRAYEYSEVHC